MIARITRRRVAPAALVSLVLTGTAWSAGVTVDPNLPEYRPARRVSGKIKSIGSDTMNNLMALWSEGFRSFHPDVEVEVEGKGSSTAPPALVAGTCTFGPMSRRMKAAEVDAFEKRYGYAPTAVRTSIDMLAVYVNKDNPIRSLTLQQIDAIFSKTRKGGHPRPIRTWGDLGLTGEWADQPISVYGRNSASGTYGYFKEHALFKGDYRDDIKEQPGSASVVQAVATDRYAIGYSGIGYRTADVRVVPLARDASSEPVPATPENAYTGRYPLARFLYLYVNRAPDRSLDPLRREFLRYVFSRQGQADVVRDGYLPITAHLAARELARLGIEVAAH